MRHGRPVNPSLDRPAYKQVADDIRDQTRTGDLQPGEGLPSEAHLAHSYGVGLNTIRTALVLLRGEGLIVTERSVGSRVRWPEEPIVIVLPPTGRVVLRPATESERLALKLPLGGFVMEVTQEEAEGDAVQVLPVRPGTVIEGSQASPSDGDG